MAKKKENKAKKPLFKKFGFWFILAAIVVSIVGGGDSDTPDVNLQQAATSMSSVSGRETEPQEKNEVVVETAAPEQVEPPVVEEPVEEPVNEAPPVVVPQIEDDEAEEPQPVGTDYVGNKNTKKFHYSWCNSVDQMKESNKYFYTGTREEMMAKGYKSCGNCHP